jgi:hypothetical protein
LTPTLLIEQARALVSTEEGRFAALQSLATTLLAVIGVVATIGATLLAGLHGRIYELVVSVAGLHISLVAVVAIAVGVLSLGALLSSGTVAIGVLRRTPDAAPEILVAVVGDQFPGMLQDAPEVSGQALLALLAHQLAELQHANRSLRNALSAVVQRLAIAVVSGLVLAVILMLGTASTVQDTHVVNTRAKDALAIKAVR